MDVSPRKSQPTKKQDFRSVGFMLSTIGYAISRGFHGVLAPLELEPSEFAVLRAVSLSPGESQQALAERLRISPSRMVAIVDGLEARGVLERRPDPMDRRVRRLQLTDKGGELLGRAIELAGGYERRVAGSLSTAERKQLLDLLDGIAGRIDLPPGAHAALRKDR